jgi:hypothetical protein
MDPGLDIRRGKEFAVARTAAEVSQLQEKWRIEDQAVVEAAEWAEKARWQKSAPKAEYVTWSDFERNLRRFDDVWIDAVGEAIGMVRVELRDEIKKLRDENKALKAELEAKTVPNFTGYWTDEKTYSRGDVCYLGGSSWFARTTTRERPSTRCDDWLLFCKSGRDGKDAK